MNSTADNPGVIAIPPLLYLGAFIVFLILQWLWPMPIGRRSVVLWPGLVLSGLGVGLAIWGRRTMIAAGTNVRPTLPAKVLVASGPFRYSRNPLYIALTLLYVGLTMIVDTWWGLIVLVPLLAVMHVGVVLREERYLARKFGESYEQYRSTVRRYV